MSISFKKYIDISFDVFSFVFSCTKINIHRRIYNRETKKANVSYFF